MHFCIHRGSKEIGGSCVEVEANGARLLLDLGLPLDADEPNQSLLPKVSGLAGPDPSFLGIILSHGHRDHWGLIPLGHDQVPLFMGAATERIMRAAAPFVPGGFAPQASGYLEDKKPFSIGPFTITPYLVDHSGFDAYAILVEAEGKRLFYSGDLRAHGRKASLFERLLRDPPTSVDVMLMEGSSLGRLSNDERFPTEGDLEKQFVDSFQNTKGMALVACSAQNIDRVVTVYRAAKRCGRKLLIDAYAAEVLKSTGSPSIPQPASNWSDVLVFIPQRQRAMLKRSGMASLVDAYRGRRVWPEELASRAPESVLLIRHWMLPELADLHALDHARVIWSQWLGYLQNGAGLALKIYAEASGLTFEEIHTSGHASPVDLQRLAAAMKPTRLVPIHTFHPKSFMSLVHQYHAVHDGEWVAT